ncbi:MAG: hypothetical protein ABIW94_04180 [Gemmatimonadaceae bacterium]
MPYTIETFSLGDMLACSLQLQSLRTDSGTMEDAAQRLCRCLYDELIDSKGSPACALVRCYKTHSFRQLPPDLQSFATRSLSGSAVDGDMKCLTLLGTAGDQPAWNSRGTSRGHQAIPLASAEMVERAPMIAQLIKEFGIELDVVLRPVPDVVHRLEGRSYGVSHVENALRSPYIPAQEDFVIPREIRSVVGFGGLLATGDLFAVILFTHPVLPAETAERFRVLALDVKRVLSAYDGQAVFG